MVETITVTTKFVVTAVTTKLVVTAVMMKLVLAAVTTKLVVTAVTTKLVVQKEEEKAEIFLIFGLVNNTIFITSPVIIKIRKIYLDFVASSVTQILWDRENRP